MVPNHHFLAHTWHDISTKAQWLASLSLGPHHAAHRLLVGNLILAVCSFVAVASRSPLEVMRDQPATGIGFVVIIGVLAGLELVFFTALPEALEARKPTHVEYS